MVQSQDGLAHDGGSPGMFEPSEGKTMDFESAGGKGT